MNVMINTYCNLKCPYCFAEDVMCAKTTSNQMSLEDFKLVLAFHKQNNMRVVRLIGGEPTLHPQFKEFVNLIVQDDFFEGVHIFTNGTFNSDIALFLFNIPTDKGVTLLFNVNEDSYLKERREQVYNNVRLLSKRMNYVNGVESPCLTTIGINFYSPNQEYKFVIDLAEECNIPYIRWSITIPNTQEKIDYRTYVRSFFNLLIDFFYLCLISGKQVTQDCNAIPLCAFEAEEIQEFLYLVPNLFTQTSCIPVFDVTPDLKVARCFGMSEYQEVNLLEYDNIQDLADEFNFLFRKIEKKILYPECESCAVFVRNGEKSCGCMKYRV